MPNSYKHGYALVVGINEYKNIRPLRKAVTDAQDVSSLLIEQCGYPEKQVILLLDANATREKLDTALDTLARRLTKDDILIVFFSGHGVQRIGGFKPGEYLCTAETDINDLLNTAISSSDLTTALGEIRAGRVVVFLDACHSGGVGDPQKPESLKAGLSQMSVAGLIDGVGRFILSSCKEDEFSLELPDMRNGLFTHYLLEGLRGKATADKDSIKVLGLCQYVAQKVPAHAREVGFSQSPWLNAKTEDFVIVELPGRTYSADVDASLRREPNLHLNFTNRHDEIEAITATTAPPYYFVHGPMGYGKSELLEIGLKERFEDLDWQCAYVKIESEAALAQVIDDLIVVLGVVLPDDKHQSWGQRLGGAICSAKWTKKCRDVVLLFDLDKKPNLEVAQALVTQVIPDVYRRLQHDHTFSELGRRFRAIIAGRHLPALRELDSSKIKFRDLPCTPFTYSVIQSVVTDRLRTLNSKSQFDLAAHLLYLTAGHPDIIAQTLHQCEKNSWIASTLMDHETQIWSSFVYPVVREIYDEMSAHDTRLRALISQMSVFRCLDYELLEHFLAKSKIPGLSDPNDLSNRLTATYLFKQHGHLYRDDITRRLLSVMLRNEHPKAFVSLCKQAQNLCLKRVSRPGEGAQIWALEYLFQVLQQYAPTVDDPEIRRRLRGTFWKNAVPRVLQAYFGRERDSKWGFEHRALVEHLRNPEDINYDWEFCFTVNYYLRKDEYDDAPMSELLRRIEAFATQTTPKV